MKTTTSVQTRSSTRLHSQCPGCGAPVDWAARTPHRPFCSDRCRMLDLGAWVTGEYCIPGASESALDGQSDEESENLS